MRLIDAPSILRWMPILLYHRVTTGEEPGSDNCVSAAVLDSQLRWLRSHGYLSVDPGSLQTWLEDPELRPRWWPRRPVLITFDDGYRDNYENAWPVLKRHGFTATIFVVSEVIGGYNDFDADLGYPRVPMLSASEIREMQAAGITFGSHSVSHPASLVGLSDECLQEELEGSRRRLEAVLDSPVPHFSYPHSQLDARVEAAVAAAGYRLAFAGVGTRFTPTCLHRVEVGSREGAALQAALTTRQLKWMARRWR